MDTQCYETQTPGLCVIFLRIITIVSNLSQFECARNQGVRFERKRFPFKNNFTTGKLPNSATFVRVPYLLQKLTSANFCEPSCRLFALICYVSPCRFVLLMHSEVAWTIKVSERLRHLWYSMLCQRQSVLSWSRPATQKGVGLIVCPRVMKLLKQEIMRPLCKTTTHAKYMV